MTPVFMRSRFFNGQPVIAELLSAILFLSGCHDTDSKVPAPLNVTVKVALPLERSDVAEYEDVRGETKDIHAVDLHCRVSGYLKKICFEDGARVEAGQPLFEIDDGSFQAAYDRAKGDLAKSEADEKFCQAELNRNNSLPKGAISQSDLDKSIAALEKAKASIVASKAAVETAKLDLDHTKINAPFAGRMSKATIAVGNLVVADQTLLSRIVSQSPIYVEFSVDEQIYNDVQDLIRLGKLDAKEQKNVPVYMKFGKETDYLHTGKLDFWDNSMSDKTGTYLLRAAFTNPTEGRLLIPKMSVDIRLPVGPPKRALLVAEQAIGADLYQKYVLVLNDKNQAEKRPVKLGTVFDGLRVIESGLTGTERVVVVGQPQTLLRPGVTIEPQEVKMQDYASAVGPKVVPSAELPSANK